MKARDPLLESARSTWEAIASSFSRTRDRPWEFVESFVKGLPRGALLLDAGAGNGRHSVPALSLGLRPIAMDVSAGLLGACDTRIPRVQAALEAPPFRARTFDAVLCIAAMHHVAGRERRLAAWRSLREVARPGAPLLASAWSSTDPRFASLLAENALASGEAGDVQVWWRHDGLAVPRFTHLYAPGELGHELAAAGWRVAQEREIPIGIARPAVNAVASANAPP